MAHRKPYRLVYPGTGQKSCVKGDVVRELTDEQVERMRRYTRHPHARLRRVEPVQQEEGGQS